MPLFFYRNLDICDIMWWDSASYWNLVLTGFPGQSLGRERVGAPSLQPGGGSSSSCPLTSLDTVLGPHFSWTGWEFRLPMASTDSTQAVYCSHMASTDTTGLGWPHYRWMVLQEPSSDTALTGGERATLFWPGGCAIQLPMSYSLRLQQEESKWSPLSWLDLLWLHPSKGLELYDSPGGGPWKARLPTQPLRVWSGVWLE